MAKMCKFYDNVSGGCYRDGRKNCPVAANSRCEIVPAKPKDVVVKAHCSGRALDCLENGIPCFVGPKLYKDDVSVTIHISAKDYARMKGGQK
jgi:hypothetical protein